MHVARRPQVDDDRRTRSADSRLQGNLTLATTGYWTVTEIVGTRTAGAEEVELARAPGELRDRIALAVLRESAAIRPPITAKLTLMDLAP